MRIRDNVDFKILEKYGFKKSQIGFDTGYVKEYKKGLFYKEQLCIFFPEGTIMACNCIELLDTIYDLIKDNLIEKGDNDE